MISCILCCFSSLFPYLSLMLCCILPDRWLKILFIHKHALKQTAKQWNHDYGLPLGMELWSLTIWAVNSHTDTSLFLTLVIVKHQKQLEIKRVYVTPLCSPSLSLSIRHKHSLATLIGIPVPLLVHAIFQSCSSCSGSAVHTLMQIQVKIVSWCSH